MLETLISVEEYLETSYHPDVDYVDGCIEERNVGEKEHGKCQARVWLLLRRLRTVKSFIETRVQTSATIYHVPDVCAYGKEPEESVFTQPPLLCVEVLSPQDRMSRVMRVVREYRSMGVPTVWILDPLDRRAYVADSNGLHEVTGEIRTADGRIALALDEIFSDDEPE